MVWPLVVLCVEGSRMETLDHQGERTGLLSNCAWISWAMVVAERLWIDLRTCMYDDVIITRPLSEMTKEARR